MKKLHLSKLIISCICIAILFVQGCKVGQKYSQPDLHMPDQYRGDTLAYFADTSSFSQISWRDFFHDPLLKELIDTALINNNDVKTALLNIEIANKKLRQNKLNYLPEVNLDIATANKQYRSSNFGSSPSSLWYEKNGTEAPSTMFTYLSQFGTEIGFSWEIDIWGKINNAKDQLTAEYLNTAEARNAIQTNLIANIAKGYFNLIMLDAKIEVAKRNVRLNDSTLHMIKLQYEAGEITALAIQQTESQRLIAASLVPDLEMQIILQENALGILTGQMPREIKRGRDIENMFPEDNNISLGSPVEIVRNRPDIRQAEFDLIAANANANIQQAMRYPTLTLEGVFGVNSSLASQWFSIPGSLLGGITGGLTTPIFKNKKLKLEWEVAKIERDKFELGLQQTVLEAVSEVSDAVVTIDKLREQIDLAKLRVANSEKAVRNALLLFRSDYATYLEVITAHGNALDSDIALVELRQAHLASYIDLYRSLGGGWR